MPNLTFEQRKALLDFGTNTVVDPIVNALEKRENYDFTVLGALLQGEELEVEAFLKDLFKRSLTLTPPTITTKQKEAFEATFLETVRQFNTKFDFDAFKENLRKAENVGKQEMPAKPELTKKKTENKEFISNSQFDLY